MARELPTGWAAVFEAKLVRPVFLVDLDWPGGAVYAWNGYGTISWNGQTYLGTGHLGHISPMRESKDGRANGIVLTMEGIPSALLPEVLANDAPGRPGKVWLTGMTVPGVFDADPYPMFDGVIDVTPIDDEGTTATISVQLEKELIDRRIHHRRNTHEDQQIESPGDDIFQYVAGLSTKEGVWGGKVIGAGSGAGSVSPGATSAKGFMSGVPRALGLD